MRKITALISALLVASAYAHGHQKAAQTRWPDINTYTTFKASGSVYTWINGKLVPYNGASAKLLVDGDRSKAMIRARAQVPLFGTVDSNMLVDFKQGYVITQVPFLGICEKQPLGFTLPVDLKTAMTTLFDPNAGLTTYKGEESPAWDASNKFWHFTHGDNWSFMGQTFGLQTYWEELSGDLKYIYSGPPNNTVFSIPNGLEPATFVDSDFVLTGCNPTVYAAESKKPSIDVNPLEKLVKLTKKAAKQARVAAKRANAAARRAELAVKKVERELKKKRQ